MEHNAIDLSDPITTKLRDSAMLARLVNQAVAEAVDKARRLGFLDQPALGFKSDTQGDIEAAP